MGAMPKLKKKIELRYRKGHTNDSENCRYCIWFIPEFNIFDSNGKVRCIESRCLLMGANQGISYRVRPDYTCDAQKFDGTDFSKGWAR
jgi:hypothetical protein